MWTEYQSSAVVEGACLVDFPFHTGPRHPGHAGHRSAVKKVVASELHHPDMTVKEAIHAVLYQPRCVDGGLDRPGVKKRSQEDEAAAAAAVAAVVAAAQRSEEEWAIGHNPERN